MHNPIHTQNQASVPSHKLATHRLRLKRVLFALALDPSKKFGSLEEQALSLAQAFQERGSLLLPLFLQPLDAASLERYRAIGLNAEFLDLRRFRASYLRRLLQIVRANRIDIIHWHFYDPLVNGYIWAMAALSPKILHYYTDHTSLSHDSLESCSLFKKLLRAPFARRLDRVFCVSDFRLEHLRTHTYWPQLTRCTHFINTKRFCPDADERRRIRAALHAEDRFVILVVAQLIRSKGVDIAIKALSILPESAVLWIIGEGEESENLHNLVADRGLVSRIRFLGLQKNVQPFMQAADCLACPSIWAEAAGLVNLEAMACGIPVVASRTGGIPEFVTDGSTGYLVPPGDELTLAERLGFLISNPDLRIQLGNQARTKVVDQFSTESVLEEHLRFYSRP